MSNALSVINKRVEQLAKKHPGSKRTTLQKQAGREYRAGKLGRIRKPAKKKSHTRKKAARPKRRVGAVNTKSRTHTDANKFKSVNIGIGSVAGHLSAARRLQVHKLGILEAKKFTAKTAKAKRHLTKQIVKAKATIRKIS